MLALPIETITTLSQDQLAEWRHRLPATLRIVRGMVWITQENDVQDHFLFAGDYITLASHSRVLIGAERESSIEIVVPQRRRPVQWAIRQWLFSIRRNWLYG